MTPAEVIRYSQADGVKLALSATGTIKATGEASAVNRWIEAIREHKAGIVEMLQTAVESNSVNSVKTGGSSVASCVSNGIPEYGNADENSEVAAGNKRGSSAKQATVATPTCEAFEERAAIMQYDAGLPKEEAEHLAAIDTGCIDCMHFARPGKSDGYCGARDDLPLAYGANHPLHKLPPDRGATCREWGPR